MKQETAMAARSPVSRRHFLTLTAAAAAGCVRREGGKRGPEAAPPGGIIRVGLIGCGARGTYLLGEILKLGPEAKAVAVCDIHEPRMQRAQELAQANAYHDWRELAGRDDVDAVIIATPNHWHAAMAIAAMEAGKDVYCETPMAHTIAEAKAFRDCARRTKRVVQIGAHRASASEWRKAKELIEAGVIGEVYWCQGRSRANVCQWDAPSDTRVTPRTVDWEAFLGSAPPRPFSADRFLRWRKYRDYSNGIVSDEHYGLLAPLLATLGYAYPERVSAAGGIRVEDGREAVDSLAVTAEYPGGRTIVLASPMAGSRDRPAVIRGREASIELYGGRVKVIHGNNGTPSGKTLLAESRPGHLANWLECARTRRGCACDEETGYRAMVAAGMASDAYRGIRTVSFDTRTHQVVVSPPRVI